MNIYGLIHEEKTALHRNINRSDITKFDGKRYSILIIGENMKYLKTHMKELQEDNERNTNLSIAVMHNNGDKTYSIIRILP